MTIRNPLKTLKRISKVPTLEHTRRTTMIPIRHAHPRPVQADRFMDFIGGELICSKCRATIREWDYEEGMRAPNTWTQQRIKEHICIHIKFHYDFNSPLTLLEQQAKAVDEAVGNSVYIPAMFRDD